MVHAFRTRFIYVVREDGADDELIAIDRGPASVTILKTTYIILDLLLIWLRDLSHQSVWRLHLLVPPHLLSLVLLSIQSSIFIQHPFNNSDLSSFGSRARSLELLFQRMEIGNLLAISRYHTLLLIEPNSLTVNHESHTRNRYWCGGFHSREQNERGGVAFGRAWRLLDV